MALAEVVGYTEEGTPILGEVMGDVEGEVMGAAPRSRMMRIPGKPSWRRQLAPGVIQPDEGMVPLPLAAQAGTPPGTFSATVASITFQGQLQKPFRAERFLVSVVRTGASATGRLLTQLFVGTDLQQAEIAGWDLELIGQANAFGTRLTTKAAEPGVFIRTVITLSGVPTGTDTIFASILALGRIIH
jgi:hypothetical protein